MYVHRAIMWDPCASCVDQRALSSLLPTRFRLSAINSFKQMIVAQSARIVFCTGLAILD